MKRFAAVVSLILSIAFLLLAILVYTSISGPDRVTMTAVFGFLAAFFFGLFIKARKGVKENKVRMEQFGDSSSRQGKRAYAKADRTIESVIVAGQESRTSTGSAVARGAVGGALLGPVGLLAAAGAKKNTDVTLVIRYQSGRAVTKTVKLKSKDFKRYSKYIH